MLINFFRLFFYSHLKSLNEGHDDHSCFYALLLINCISQNKGILISFIILILTVSYYDSSSLQSGSLIILFCPF